MLRTVNDEPQWLKDFRQKAFTAMKKLPLEESQLFTKYTDPSELSLENFKPDFSESKIPGEFSNQKGLIFVQNGADTFVSELSADLQNKGVIFADMRTAIKEHPDKLIKYFSDNWKDKIEAFNAAFFANGVFIHVPKNVEITIPFRKIHLENASNLSSKNIVIGGDKSKFTIIEEYYSVNDNEKPAILTTVTDLHLGQGCEIIFGSLQNLGENVVNADIKRCFCDSDSRISWNLGSFGSRLTRSRVESFMNGAGCVVEDNEIVFGAGNQKFDIMSNLLHMAGSTSGVTRIKSVLKDSSKVVMKGMIKISKKGKNSNSYLSEHAMLLSKDAKADAIPGLEIENNDVKATHSASVAKINDDQMFYLMSRGLDENTSKKLMIDGFLESIIQHMPLPQLRNLIRTAINSKWTGNKRDLLTDYAENSLEAIKEMDIFGGHYKYR